jgi:integrase
MASIVRDPNGRKRILYFNADGERKPLRLGVATMGDAREVATRIGLLVAAKRFGTTPEPNTIDWLASIGDELHAKLADHGLVAPRAKAERGTLAAFLDSYIAKQADKKRSTIVCLTQCRNDLVAFFGADKQLTDVSEGDAEDWRNWLRQKRIAHPGRPKSPTARASQASKRDRNKPKQEPKRLQENTIRRRCGRARQLFQAAVRHRLIARNPFAELKGVSVMANKSRDYFVTRDEAAKVLEACPDSQWKLLFVLSRYAGLRCPSEHLGLRWSDIDWAANRIVVRSPKTEHHEGKEHRVIPLFPELRPYLEAVRDEVNPGIDVPFSAPVITRYRDANANLRTQLLRIIAGAGLSPWPKLFQNLRASRATELAKEHPGHVAAAWLGHSTEVAQRHYWQVTDADFERATAADSVVTGGTAQNPAHSANIPGTAAQNPAQSDTVRGIQGGVRKTDYCENTDDYELLRYLTTLPVAEAGVEPARGLPLNGF